MTIRRRFPFPGDPLARVGLVVLVVIVLLSLVSLKDRALGLGETVALHIEPRHCRIL